MKQIVRFGVGMLILLAVSCAPLRKSQAIVVGNYFRTVTEYPTNIRALNEKRANLVLENQILQTGMHKSDSVRLLSLFDALQQYEQNQRLPDSIMFHVDVLEKYIQGYFVVAPNGFNIYGPLKGTSVTVASLFGLRSAASTLIPDKTVNVSSSKKKKIYRHFKDNSAEMRLSAQFLKKYIDVVIIPQIDETSDKLRENVLKLYGNEQAELTALDIYFDKNKYFIGYFQKVNQIRRLATKISGSLQLLLDTETEIQRMTAERQKIERDSRNLYVLVSELQRINKLLIEISK